MAVSAGPRRTLFAGATTTASPGDGPSQSGGRPERETVSASPLLSDSNPLTFQGRQDCQERTSERMCVRVLLISLAPMVLFPDDFQWSSFDSFALPACRFATLPAWPPRNCPPYLWSKFDLAQYCRGTDRLYRAKGTEHDAA
jgi:hypothetical protein